MTFNPALTVTLLAIVPALIVAVALWLRISTLQTSLSSLMQGYKGISDEKFLRFEKIVTDYDTILINNASLDNKINEATVKTDRNLHEINSLRETVTSLQNKFAALKRWEKAQQQPESEVMPDEDDIIIEGDAKDQLEAVANEQTALQQQPPPLSKFPKNRHQPFGQMPYLRK